MRNIVALVLAIILAYAIVSFFGWLIWNLWWLALSLAKLVVIVIVALPLYVIVRKRLLRQ
ncbi:MAG: hypothetical protein KatS3mg039_0195 [Candidatus Kapaibacterium sp.]|nr:MAG: hypothetical protein KatS3mg039_0195 [Candidatus Kapabacteria bacterium]